MRIFLDSDVLLDLLLIRKPWNEHIFELLKVLSYEKASFSTSVLAAANIHYILRKNTDNHSASKRLAHLTENVLLMGITATAFLKAQKSDFKDFEDGIQYQCCFENNIDYIITRNTKDYISSSIPVFKADEMIIHLLNQR